MWAALWPCCSFSNPYISFSHLFPCPPFLFPESAPIPPCRALLFGFKPTPFTFQTNAPLVSNQRPFGFKGSALRFRPRILLLKILYNEALRIANALPRIVSILVQIAPIPFLPPLVSFIRQTTSYLPIPFIPNPFLPLVSSFPFT